jgi:death-on-curing protein
VFLDVNGHEPNLDEDGAFELVMDVAGGLSDVDEIGRRLRVRARAGG